MEDHFKASEFTLDSRWWLSLIWGGGFTHETDPTRQGWRAARVKKGSEILLIGRRGMAGCASVLRGSALDVALYIETPEEVAACIKEGNGATLDPIYVSVPETPGWGLAVIEKIRDVLARDQ